MDYGSQDVVCPFYKDERGNTIRCEGLVSVACVNNFINKGQKISHLKKYCCSEYESCPLAIAIDYKYIQHG